MTKKQEQWYSLDETQLWRLAGRNEYADANSAWHRFSEIKEAGGKPVAYYSEGNGFWVLDESDNEQQQLSWRLAMGARSFPRV